MPLSSVITCRSPECRAITWRYRVDGVPSFDPVVFDAQALHQRGLVTGIPDGGRGGTVFFELDGCPLVLREYRRGGLIRHLSTRSYMQTGLERSRAMREFGLLHRLESIGLPVPRVFAAQRSRRALLESGELVMHRLTGSSLAERALDGRTDATEWAAVGRCIARFHAAGVEHADLNAHNILIDVSASDGSSANRACPVVHLLDFDRGRIHDRVHDREPVNVHTAWAAANLQRLSRSLKRLGVAQGMSGLSEAWQESLQVSASSSAR